MPYQLSLSSLLEKNKIFLNDPILIFLEILIPNPDLSLYIVRDNKDATCNGRTWTAYPFNIGSLSEDTKGELPHVPINIRTSYEIIKYLEDSNGAQDAKVNLYFVHAGHLDKNDPMAAFEFGVSGVTTTDETITIDLGPDIIIISRYPIYTYGKERCRYLKYGCLECGISDAVKAQYPTCNRTLADCRTRGNSSRFGGHPGIPGGNGIYVTI
jgi:phage-related protein